MNHSREEGLVHILCIIHVILMGGTTWGLLSRKALDIYMMLEREGLRGRSWLTAAESPYFDSFIHMSVVLNITATIIELTIEPAGTTAMIFLVGEISFSAIYTVEAIVKINAYTWRVYWSSIWNKIDFSLLCSCILFSLVDFVSAHEALLNPTILKMLRMLRLLRSLRFMKVAALELKQLYEELYPNDHQKHQEMLDEGGEEELVGTQQMSWDKIPPPPASVPEWYLMDYVFYFAISTRTYYTCLLMMLSICGTYYPIFHFLQLIDFYRLPMAQLTMIAVKKSGRGIASTLGVMLLTLVIINGVDFLIFQDEPFGMDWDDHDVILSGSLYAHFFRGILNGMRGDLGDSMGIKIQQLESQAPSSMNDQYMSQLQSLIGVVWVMLYGFAFVGIVAGQITDGYVQTRDRELHISNDERER